MKTFEISATSPFNFDLTFKATPPAAPFEYKNGILKRALRLESRKLIPIKVNSIATVEKPILKITALKNVNANEKNEIIDKLTWFFCLDRDLSKAYVLMDKDPVLSWIKKRLYGCKPWTVLTPFEGIVDSIIFQQISIWAAFAMMQELVKKLGEKVVVNGEIFYEFPSIETLANTNIKSLKNCKLSRNKAAYIKNVANKIIDGELDIEKLQNSSTEEALEILKKLKGIGTWTAELILAAGLKRWGIIPADDLGIRRALSKFYFKGKVVTGQDAREFSKQWGDYKWLIIYYLLVASERL